MSVGKTCNHFERREPSVEGRVWCSVCQSEVKFDPDGVWRAKPEQDAGEEAKANPVASNAWSSSAFDEELEDNIKRVEGIMKMYTGQHSDPTVRSLAEAVLLLLNSVHAPGESKLEERVQGIETQMAHLGSALAGRVAKLEREAREFQPWRIGESPVGLLQRIEKLEKEVRRGPVTLGDVTALFTGGIPPMKTAPTSPDAFTKRDARPTIVCLCGSTRFGEAFAKANLEETLAGKIVLSVGSMTHSDAAVKVCVFCRVPYKKEAAVHVDKLCRHPMYGYPPTYEHDFKPLTDPAHAHTKAALDSLHKKKIELADEVFVLNVVACSGCLGEHLEGYEEMSCSSGKFPALSRHDIQPYIGESTKSEIKHALELKKPIRFLNPQGPGLVAAVTRDYYEPVPGMSIERMLHGLGLA